MKITLKFWIVTTLVVGVVLVSLATSIQGNFGNSQAIITEAGDGVTFDFSANPIEEEIYLYSSWEGGAFEENRTISKKVIGGSCSGAGMCVIGTMSAQYRLERIVYKDGTYVDF